MKIKMIKKFPLKKKKVLKDRTRVFHFYFFFSISHRPWDWYISTYINYPNTSRDQKKVPFAFLISFGKRKGHRGRRKREWGSFYHSTSFTEMNKMLDSLNFVHNVFQFFFFILFYYCNIPLLYSVMYMKTALKCKYRFLNNILCVLKLFQINML